MGESDDAWLVTLVLRDPIENGRLLHALWQHTRWDLIFWSMLDAGVAASSAGEDPERAACDEFITAERRTYEVLSAITRPEWLPSEMREGVAAVLCGEVGAQVSLAHNKRLKAALTEGNGSARDRLSQELPGAVIHEWGSPSNSYSPLLRRVTSLLEAEGGEQGRLERAGKLAGELTDTVGGEDEDLAEFERQETLRQDIDRLRGWVQNAGFSEREAQVYELDMQTNHNTVVIACKLGIDEDTVRGYRKRYRDKIRESRKAAGL